MHSSRFLSPIVDVAADDPATLRQSYREFRKQVELEVRCEDNASFFYMLDRLEKEQNAQAFRSGLLALITAAFATGEQGATQESAPRTAQPGSNGHAKAERARLGDWLWEPFKERSVVLGVSARDHYRRDEPAQIQIARRLSFEDFPRTEFPRVMMGECDLANIVHDKRCQAICVVGRLGLFGQEVVEQLQNEDLCFGFEVTKRPPSLRLGDLHDDYHRIYEQVQHGHREYYPTTEEGGVRTDYALVQRYTMRFGEMRMVVVRCAGATSLGTLGASAWAARGLFRSNRAVDIGPIEPPGEGIAAHSQMEALLEVKAKATGGPWTAPTTSLKKLYVDGKEWSAQKNVWGPRTPRLMSLVIDDRDRMTLLFDGSESKMKPDSVAFRLTAALIRHSVGRQGETIPIEVLVKDEELWEGGEAVRRDVIRHLNTLRRRYLRDALTMADGVFCVHAKAEILEAH